MFSVLVLVVVNSREALLELGRRCCFYSSPDSDGLLCLNQHKCNHLKWLHLRWLRTNFVLSVFGDLKWKFQFASFWIK